jgi:hypothetical protein
MNCSDDLWRAQVRLGCGDSAQHDPAARVPPAGGGGTHGAHAGHGAQRGQTPRRSHRCREPRPQGQPDIPARPGNSSTKPYVILLVSKR